MKRYLYILDTETGDETGHVDITDKSERDIIRIEAELRARCTDGVVIRDSANDPR